MRVSLTGAYGIGSENAEIVLDPQFSDTEVKSDFGKTYEIGAGFHYFALDNLSLSLSLSYGQNEAVTKIKTRVFSGIAFSDGEVKLTYPFLQAEIAARYYFSNLFFGGAGFYYGTKAGDFKEKSTLWGIVSEEKINDSITKPNTGFFIEIGLEFPIDETLSLSLSGKFKKALQPVYEDKNAENGIDPIDGFDDVDLKTVQLNSLLIQIGINYKF